MAQIAPLLSRERPPGGFLSNTMGRPPSLGLGMGQQATAAAGPATAGVSTMASLKQQADRMLEQQHSMETRAEKYRTMWQTVMKEQEQSAAELTKERALHADLRAKMKEDARHAQQLFDKVAYLESQQHALLSAVTDASNSLHQVHKYRQSLELKLSEQMGMCTEFQEKYSTLEDALTATKDDRDAALKDVTTLTAALQAKECALQKAVDQRESTLQELAMLKEQLDKQRKATEAAEAAMGMKCSELQALEQVHEETKQAAQARQNELEADLATARNRHTQAQADLSTAHAKHDADADHIKRLQQHIATLEQDKHLQEAALATAQGRMEQLTVQLAAAEQERDALQTQLTAAQEQVAALQERLQAAVEAAERAAELEGRLRQAKDQLESDMAEKQEQLNTVTSIKEQLEARLAELQAKDLDNKLAETQKQLEEVKAAAAAKQAALETQLKAANDAAAGAEKEHKIFVAHTHKEFTELRARLTAEAAEQAAELRGKLEALQTQQAELDGRLSSEHAACQVLKNELEAAKVAHEAAMCSMNRNAEAMVEQERNKLAEQAEAAAKALQAAQEEAAKQLAATKVELLAQLEAASTAAAADRASKEEALACQQEAHEEACRTLMEQVEARDKEAEESQAAWADKVETLEGSVVQLHQELAAALNQVQVLEMRVPELEAALSYEKTRNARVIVEMQQRLGDAATQPAAAAPGVIATGVQRQASRTHPAAVSPGSQPAAGLATACSQDTSKPSQAVVVAEQGMVQLKTSQLIVQIPAEPTGGADGTTPVPLETASEPAAAVQLTVQGTEMVKVTAEAAAVPVTELENQPAVKAAPPAAVKANTQTYKANTRRANKRPAPEPSAAPALWDGVVGSDEEESSPEAAALQARMFQKQEKMAELRRKRARGNGGTTATEVPGGDGMRHGVMGPPPPVKPGGVQRQAASHKGSRLGAMGKTASVQQSAGVSEIGPEASSKQQGRKAAAGRSSGRIKLQEQAGGGDVQARKQPRNKNYGTNAGGGGGNSAMPSAAANLFGQLSSNPYAYN